MTAIMTERTARKEYRCNRCRRPIPSGARYRDWRLPPGDGTGGLGNTGWLRQRVHVTYDECQSRPCELECPVVLADAYPGLCCVCEAPEPRETP